MLIDNQPITTIAAPIVVGLISWFIKDYVFSLMQKRQEALRTEWRSRLIDCWSPLFFWSGVVLAYSGLPTKKEEAVKELEKILAKNANLIPLNHYHALVKLIEVSTGAIQGQFDMHEIEKTRAYIYKQIELHNFVLFKKDMIFEPSSHVSLFGSQQALLRLSSQIVQHVVSWGVLALYLYAIYRALLNEKLALSLILLLPVVLVVMHDLRKKYKLDQESAPK